MIDCATGAELTRAELVPHLLAARVIAVGELHDRASHHLAQRDLIALVHAEDPSLAIGMEMFERRFQAPLDAYVAAEIDEAAMLEQTEWSERWAMDVALYRPILELARRERVRIVALNARRELTRTLAREGEAALPGELRAELPADMDRDDAEHREMVMSLLGGHAHGEGGMSLETLERFYLAQLVWDETMGEVVATTLGATDAPHRMVVVAGRAHVWSGLGIPRRAARRGAAPHVVVLPASPSELEELRSRCDYAWLVPEEPAEAQ